MSVDMWLLTESLGGETVRLSEFWSRGLCVGCTRVREIRDAAQMVNSYMMHSEKSNRTTVGIVALYDRDLLKTATCYAQLSS